MPMNERRQDQAQTLQVTNTRITLHSKFLDNGGLGSFNESIGTSQMSMCLRARTSGSLYCFGQNCTVVGLRGRHVKKLEVFHLMF